MYRNKITHSDINIDPELEGLLPPLTGDEFKALEDSIFADGIQDAVKVWINPEDSQCYLVDGHNRYTIMDKYGKVIPQDKITVLEAEKYKTKDDVIFYMIQFQLGRRSMSVQARYIIVQKYKPLLEKKAKENLSNGGKGLTTLTKVNTRKEASKMVGCSEGTYHKLDKIFESDDEEIKQKLIAEEITINAGFNKLPKKEKKHKEIVNEKIETQKFHGIINKEIADLTDTSLEYCFMYNFVNESGDEEIKQKMMSEEISVEDCFQKIIGVELNFPTLDDVIASKVGFKSGIEFRRTEKVVDKIDELKASGNKEEAKKLTDILNNQSLTTAEEYMANPTPVSKTVADYDKEISNVDAEIKALYEKKTQLIQDRHEAFQADNHEMRCEHTVLDQGIGWANYSFYLIKGENKIDLFKYMDSFFAKDYTEFMEDIEKKLKYFEFTSEYSKLSKDEKAVITAKLVDMRETVKQDRQKQIEAEEARKKVRDESFNQNLNQALGNLFRPQFNPEQKEVLKKIYKAGAKALHSDTNGGTDEAMQILNQFKESWGV